MYALSTEDWKDRYELWKRYFIRKHGGDPDDENRYLAFFAAIEGAKNIKDLIKRIDDFDPYNYKIIMACVPGPKIVGLWIQVQFEKGKDVYRIPKEQFSYMEITSSLFDVPRNRVAFCLIKDVK